MMCQISFLTTKMISIRKKMRTKVLILLAMLLSCVLGFAQTNEQMKKQIADVKRSSSYIYGEATASTTEEAYSMAEEILYDEIAKWLNKEKKLRGNDNVVVSNRKDIQTSLSLPRGNMFRSFIYVKKSDVLPVENVEVLNIINEENSDSTLEQRKVSKDDATAYVEEAEENMEVEVAEEEQETTSFPEIVNLIASYTDYYNVKGKVEELKEKGQIRRFDGYSKLENPNIYYLIIYNKAGKVVALLSPGAERINVKTGKADKVTNYKDCAAIGFTLNE